MFYEANDLDTSRDWCIVLCVQQETLALSAVSAFLAYFVRPIFVRITSAVRIYSKKTLFAECYLLENDLHLTIQFQCTLLLIFLYLLHKIVV
jgi:hypothetical protein